MAHLSKRLLVIAGALASMVAEPAEAGTFHVYGLGMNSAGCPNGWQAQSSGDVVVPYLSQGMGVDATQFSGAASRKARWLSMCMA